MKEINGTSLEELEALYEALLEGQEDPDGVLSSMMQKELEAYFHQVKDLCSLEHLLKSLTPFQKMGLLEEFEGLEEGDFQDSVFLEALTQRMLAKEQLFLRLTHSEEGARQGFLALAESSAPTLLSAGGIQPLLIFMKVGLVACYKENSTYHAFVPEEVKTVYRTLVQEEIEDKAQKVQYLYDFCRAAVNLYGVISLKEVVDVYTQYHEGEDATNFKEQLQHTLLEYIPALLEIELWEDAVMAEHFVMDKEARTELLMDQQGKPRYCPESVEEFLRYKEETYVRPYVEQKAMRSFFEKNSSQDEQENLEELLLCISFEQKFSLPVERTLHTIAEMGFMPKTKELQEEMLDYLIPMDGFARKWEHKGFSSSELHLTHPNVMPMPERPKGITNGMAPSKNGPCPCGSGKKYKRCCMS